MARNKPSLHKKLWILDQCKWKCIYCKEPLTLDTVEFDHSTPYSIERTCQTLSLVASCRTCNQIKSDLHCPTIEGKRDYVHRKRKQQGLPYLQEYIQDEKEVASVLQPKMQIEVVETTPEYKICAGCGIRFQPVNETDIVCTTMCKYKYGKKLQMPMSKWQQRRKQVMETLRKLRQQQNNQ